MFTILTWLSIFAICFLISIFIEYMFEVYRVRIRPYRILKHPISGQYFIEYCRIGIWWTDLTYTEDIQTFEKSCFRHSHEPILVSRRHWFKSEEKAREFLTKRFAKKAKVEKPEVVANVKF